MGQAAVREKVNPVHALIGEFEKEYRQAFADALVAKDHTDTTGWRQLYENERREERDETKRIAEGLKLAGETLLMAGPTEDGEKEVQDLKKRLIALRERVTNFDAHTVEPVREPADRCRDIINRYRNKAEQIRGDSPLHHNQIVAEMEQAIGEQNQVRWDVTKGTVEIDPATVG